MAEKVNLDALIKREDFLMKDGAEGGGQKGKESASATDLSSGESFFATLRKPDFQRETAAWTPQMVCDIVKAFVNNDLIPSVICWQSPSRLSFVIDGAHRLSAIIAWIMDDYGDGDASAEACGNKIPDEQERIAERTRELIKNQLWSYKAYKGETKTPGSIPELGEKVRALAHAVIPLQWVNASDSYQAERAFFTINQSAVEIDPTELKILNARTEPNAISARAIVRNAGGHKYWAKFSEVGQSEIVGTAKSVYAALYQPPFNPPIRTEDLPIAGHGYGSQTLPLIFDCVNIANNLPVIDSSKKKKKFEVVENRPDPDESKTIQVIRKTERIVNRLTGTHPSSLGLHPAVYFYARNARHQPTAVLAMIQLVCDLEKKDSFNAFSEVRKAFEEFLVNHKFYINQLTVAHGSMVKGFIPVRDYYEFVLNKCMEGCSEAEIETALGENPKYQKLVKEKPNPTKRAKAFSSNAKQVKLMDDILRTALICNECGARIDKKSMHLDHTVDVSKGGAGDIDNSQWLHPYCDSAFKYHRKARA